MSFLDEVSESNLSAETLAKLEPFRLKGAISGVYLQIANSEAALRAYLDMENALKASSLSLREIEAIKLLVSQLNQCDYCLSVHHMKASVAGLTDSEKRSIRLGLPIDDIRLDPLLNMVRNFFRAPGPVSKDDLLALRSAGFSDGELVDISMAVATIFFTNVFNHINNTVSALPAAPEV